MGDLEDYYLGSVGDVLVHQMIAVLTQCQPYPGDSPTVDPTVDSIFQPDEPQFVMEHLDFDMFVIYDHIQGFDAHIHLSHLHWSTFLVGKWFAELCARHNRFPYPWEHAHCWLSSWSWKDTTMGKVLKWQAEAVLHLGAPYPNEEDNQGSTKGQFEVTYNLTEIK